MISAITFCSCSDGDDESYMLEDGTPDFLFGNAPFHWITTPEYIPTGKYTRTYREFQISEEGGTYVFECTNYKDFTFKKNEWADVSEPYELRFMHLHATISGNILTVEISPLTDEDKSSYHYNKFYPFTVENDNAFFVFSFNHKYDKPGSVWTE